MTDCIYGLGGSSSTPVEDRVDGPEEGAPGLVVETDDDGGGGELVKAAGVAGEGTDCHSDVKLSVVLHGGILLLMMMIKMWWNLDGLLLLMMMMMMMMTMVMMTMMMIMMMVVMMMMMILLWCYLEGLLHQSSLLSGRLLLTETMSLRYWLKA